MPKVQFFLTLFKGRGQVKTRVHELYCKFKRTFNEQKSQGNVDKMLVLLTMSCGPGPENRQPRQPWLGDQKKFAQVAIFCAVFAFNGLGTKTDFQDQACGTVEAIFANNF